MKEEVRKFSTARVTSIRSGNFDNFGSPRKDAAPSSTSASVAVFLAEGHAHRCPKAVGLIPVIGASGVCTVWITVALGSAPCGQSDRR